MGICSGQPSNVWTLNTLRKNMWTTKHAIPKPRALICCYNHLHSSGFRHSTRFWSLAAGICSLLATSTLVSLMSGDEAWLKARVPFLNCCHKVWSKVTSKLSLHTVVLKCTFIEIRVRVKNMSQLLHSDQKMWLREPFYNSWTPCSTNFVPVFAFWSTEAHTSKFPPH